MTTFTTLNNFAKYIEVQLLTAKFVIWIKEDNCNSNKIESDI